VPGLGFLEIETVLTGTKRLAQTSGVELATGMPVRGYEMRIGQAAGTGLERPMLRLAGDPDGCVSADGMVAGCYLHGLFTSDPFRRQYLASLGAEPGEIAYEHSIETTLESLADHLENCLDLSAFLAAARPPRLMRAA
jgi:adenosylcobyric acid synthase